MDTINQETTTITDAERILDLRAQLNDHAFRYYVSNCPTISDQEYDVLFKTLSELEKLHPEMADVNSPTSRVGSLLPTSMKKVQHKVKMLSLDNLNSLDETLKFFDKQLGQPVTLEMKIDGLSLNLHYENGQLVQAVTRGDGSEGEDVTANARTILTLPLTLREPVNIDVRGEVYWRLSSFNTYNARLPDSQQYANPRNGASGIMRQIDSKEVAECHLDFVAYSIPTDVPDFVETQENLLEYLENLGFRTTTTLDITRDIAGWPYMTVAATPQELEPAIATLNKYRQALDLDTDGLVIKLSSLALQRDLGEGQRSPKWAAAYKFPPETKATKLLSVTIQVGRTGQIAPVAELEPVSLGGTVVKRATLCNQDELDRLGIDVGDEVLVCRAGQVIPGIVGLAKAAPGKENVNKSFQIPKNCPCCHTALVRPEGKVHLFCPNPLCHDQVYGRLVNATGKDGLDIDGLGEVGVQTLMFHGNVKQLSDLFMTANFSVFKTAQRQKVQKSVERAKLAPLWRKIVALNIDGIGKVSAQDLAAKYTSLTTMYNDPEGLKKVIGEVAALNFRYFVEDNIDELERLASAGFKLESDPATSGPLSGKSFCITGKLQSGARDEVSALIEKHGGRALGAVSRKCNYLVQGGNGGNNKAADAAKYGTTIISEEALYQMLGLPMPIAKQNTPEIEA